MVRSNEREGVPTGHSLLLLSKTDRLTVGQVWGCPPPPLGKVPYIGHMLHRGESTQGPRPLYPGGLFHIVPGISGGFCAYLLIGPLHHLWRGVKVESVFVVAVVLYQPLCHITKSCVFHI